MNIPCIKCKGADPINACGRAFCPILAKSESLFKVKEKLTLKDFSGSSPAPFVGRFGYPDINVGVLSPIQQDEDAWLYDPPHFWSENNFAIPKIIDLRSSLVNSRFKANIRQTSHFLEISQEVGMASKPVDIDVELKDKPRFRLQSDSYLAPTGPNGTLENVKITSNPKIDTKVDKVVSDTDLKADNALQYLYAHGFEENFLSKLLSVGTLGIKKSRKLVPTRWSITAVDDSLGNKLISEIKQHDTLGYTSYFGSYLGNYFLVLFFPDVWSYELFETYMPKASWNPSNTADFTTDYEPYQGRTSYAENCGGGYYAARLPIVEKLAKIKKQGSVLCLRFITGEYAVPLGVWVVREAVKKAMVSKPLEFSDKEIMLSYAKALVKKKFGYNLDFILSQSIILKDLKTQRKLTAFI